MIITINDKQRTYCKEKYDKETILKRCENALKEKASDFYNIDPINYTGATSDTDDLYTEVIAEWLNNKIDRFDTIPIVTREQSYLVKSHNGETSQKGNDVVKREEEHIAKWMYKNSYANIGKVIDYQVPLKDYTTENNEIKVGKIDLLAVNEDKNTIYIIELKRPKTNETLLRCILEGYTYYKRLNKKKLLEDMKRQKKLNKDIENYKIILSPLFFKYEDENKNEKSQPYKEVEEREFRPKLFEFIKQLVKHEKEYEKKNSICFFGGVEPYYLEESEEKTYSCHQFPNYDY